MFKKSLIAIALAGTAISAQAGTVYSGDTAATAVGVLSGGAAANALGADGALLGGDDNCDVAATDLGVTLGNTGNGEGGSDDAITFVAGTDFTAATVAMTGAGACTVTHPLIPTTTSLLSPTEAAAGTVTVGASIDPGLGGFDAEDTITLTFSGANIDLVNTVAPTLVATDAAAATTTLNLLDITATTVRFTIPAAPAEVGAQEVVRLGGIVLDNSGVTSSTDVTLSYFATNTSATDYDITAATKVHGFVPQYSAAVSVPLNGVIDVQEDRQSLNSTTPEATADEDRLTVALSLDATANQITPDDITVTIGGDFAWLDTSADTSDDATAATAAELATYLGAWFTAGTDDTVDSVSLNAELDELTVVVNAVGGVVDASHQFDIPVEGPGTGNPVLPEQTFTVSAVVDDGAAAPATILMTAATDAAAGSWTLNGSVLEVPYLPFGPVTQPIIRHTNTGNQTGDIALRYMVEGEHTTWQDAGVIVSQATPGVRNLLTETTSALAAEGYDASASGFKVALEYTTNVPTGDVALTVGAKFSNQTDTDRLSIGIIK